MIKDLTPINFPEYAHIVSATATLNDMGDKTISMQVKIDGSITPDFSFDWEIEFQGERYIQPLREPQASKGNESIYSIIDLTFYHKGIYDLKRYFFVSVVELDAETIMADNYIVPLRLNIKGLVDYLRNVLNFYFGNAYLVRFNANFEYEETDVKDIDINYTKIWNLLTRIYELFGARWEIYQEDENAYCIEIGWKSRDVSHIFEYGFEGGLLKFERQVQDSEIANVVLGRGSSENIPFRYFKNKSEDNPTFPADPDWIPELENVYFANLRGKTFRDYVQGWKTNPNRNTLDGTLPIEQLDWIKWMENEAYQKGHEDTTFNPIEYVKDDESIAKYGEIQKGLEHNETIKPTIQGVSIDDIGRVDQIVDVKPILVDESTENTEVEKKIMDVDITESVFLSKTPTSSYTYTIGKTFTIPSGYKGSFIKDFGIEVIQNVGCSDRQYSTTSSLIDNKFRKRIDHPLEFEIVSFNIVEVATKEPLDNLVEIEGGTSIYIEIKVKFWNFFKQVCYFDDELRKHGYDPLSGNALERTPDGYFYVNFDFSWELDYTPIHGQILGNYESDESGITRISQSVTIKANGTSQVKFDTENFTISEDNAPATSVDMPYRITSSLKNGTYNPLPNVVAINVETGETMTSLNLPAGTYYLRNSIQITNLADKPQTFKVELLPTYIYYSYDAESWKPTFDIWIKNIWQTRPNELEEDYTYEHRIWDAILGNHLGDDAKIVFSSGRLSGHSDWEFVIADTPKYDTSKSLDGVSSHWRITLYKSDAEIDATDKWLPSIMTQASMGDHFYFTGIEFPHQYVLWAEEKLDQYKRDELAKSASEKSPIVVQLDKVRVNESRNDDDYRPLMTNLRIGYKIKVADSRFIKSRYEVLHIQSVTYTWDASTIIYPNVEIVLSDKVYNYNDPIKAIKNSISLIEQDAIQTNKQILSQHAVVSRKIKDVNTLAKQANTSANNTKTIAIQAQSQAQKASDGLSANKEETFLISKQLNALIGNDKNRSVRDIAANTATQLITVDNNMTITNLLPNIVYDYSLLFFDIFTIPQLSVEDDSYDNKWMVRFSITSSKNVKIPFTVFWKDGITPSWDSWCICEMIFIKSTISGAYIGEWKIYK